jgi:hypothetical protein
MDKFTLDANNNCVACPTNCLHCQITGGLNTCTKWEKSPCDAGKYYKSDTLVCEACTDIDANCAECNSAGICTKAKDTYFISIRSSGTVT